MEPVLTQFGVKMSHLSGVRAIMKDIIETLQASKGQNFINLSAGNPVILPEVEQLWRDCTAELLSSREYGEVVCRYGISQGYQPLIEAVKDDFNQRYGWKLGDRNILITPGSQAIYFWAANVFGGYTPDRTLKQIVLPLSPDYTGYGSISLTEDVVYAYKPTIEMASHRFKYRPDFSQLQITENTGCAIFSRPCNPTGNVLSDDEVQKIAAIASTSNVPVFIDSAYGPPYPALNFTGMTPVFADNIVHCLSLSKAGLPGERIGVAIGSPKILNVLESFQTNLCIHSSRYGQAIAALAIKSGKLGKISDEVIRPFYQKKFEIVESTLDEVMPKELPWFLHRGEGAIFAWLWLQDLPITDWEFYEKLKQVGVIVVPGSPFFPGMRSEWQHKQECMRISLTATNDEIVMGIGRLAKVVEEVYNKGS